MKKLYIVVSSDGVCLTDPYRVESDLLKDHKICKDAGEHIIDVPETDPSFNELLQIAK